jgi:hypothetical protein
LHFDTDDGIVVGGRAERVAMEFDAVPTPLRDCLGHEATAGLIALIADARKDWTAEVMGSVGDRFERRLTEETSKLRLEMTQGFAGLRQEMAAGFAAVHQEMADQRFELLKWAFLFWVGQFFAVAGLIAVLVRFLRPAG